MIQIGPSALGVQRSRRLATRLQLFPASSAIRGVFRIGKRPQWPGGKLRYEGAGQSESMPGARDVPAGLPRGLPSQRRARPCLCSRCGCAPSLEGNVEQMLRGCPRTGHRDFMTITTRHHATSSRGACPSTRSPPLPSVLRSPTRPNRRNGGQLLPQPPLRIGE
jgi:hypothetical protein